MTAPITPDDPFAGFQAGGQDPFAGYKSKDAHSLGEDILGAVNTVGKGALGPLYTKLGVALTTPVGPGWSQRYAAHKQALMDNIAAFQQHHPTLAPWLGEGVGGAAQGAASLFLPGMGAAMEGASALASPVARSAARIGLGTTIGGATAAFNRAATSDGSLSQQAQQVAGAIPAGAGAGAALGTLTEAGIPVFNTIGKALNLRTRGAQMGSAATEVNKRLNSPPNLDNPGLPAGPGRILLDQAGTEGIVDLSDLRKSPQAVRTLQPGLAARTAQQPAKIAAAVQQATGEAPASPEMLAAWSKATSNYPDLYAEVNKHPVSDPAILGWFDKLRQNPVTAPLMAGVDRKMVSQPQFVGDPARVAAAERALAAARPGTQPADIAGVMGVRVVDAKVPTVETLQAVKSGLGSLLENPPDAVKFELGTLKDLNGEGRSLIAASEAPEIKALRAADAEFARQATIGEGGQVGGRALSQHPDVSQGELGALVGKQAAPQADVLKSARSGAGSAVMQKVAEAQAPEGGVPANVARKLFGNQAQVEQLRPFFQSPESRSAFTQALRQLDLEGRPLEALTGDYGLPIPEEAGMTSRGSYAMGAAGSAALGSPAAAHMQRTGFAEAFRKGWNADQNAVRGLRADLWNTPNTVSGQGAQRIADILQSLNLSRAQRAALAGIAGGRVADLLRLSLTP